MGFIFHIGNYRTHLMVKTQLAAANLYVCVRECMHVHVCAVGVCMRKCVWVVVVHVCESVAWVREG